MSHDVKEKYQALLEQTAVPFEAVTEKEDWHLRVFFLPEFSSEIIFDVDHRKDRTLFHRSRFLSWVWPLMKQAQQTGAEFKPVSVEHGYVVLPAAHQLVKLITDQHLVKEKNIPWNHRNGDAHCVELTRSTGVVDFDIYISYRMNQMEYQFLDALHTAASLLPQTN